MTGKAQLSLFCPAMPVKAVNMRLRRTAEEPMVATLTMPDGSKITVQPITIPETDVHRLRLLHWQVEACVGQGAENGNSVTVHLPTEPVTFDLKEMTMVAREITARVTVELSDGSIGIGEVVFPDCPTNLLTGVAQAVTAKGSVIFQ